MGDSGRGLNQVPNPSEYTLCSTLNSSSAIIPSTSKNAFITETHLINPSSEPLLTLIDSGASRNFIDQQLARLFPKYIYHLHRPIPLTLFDGSASSAGQITQALKAPIFFQDNTTHEETFLLTKLHSSAQLVLGLPWLKKYNPTINWKDLTFSFENGIPLILGHMGRGFITIPSEQITTACSFC